MMKRLLAITAIILPALFIAACDVGIGLGSRINIKGPVLEITEPVALEGQTGIAVNDIFFMGGTASTPDTVTRLEIKMQYYDAGIPTITNAMGREWYYEGGWYYRAYENSKWGLYSGNDYGMRDDPDNPVKPQVWKVTGDTVQWGLPIFMYGLPVGDYFLTVTAWDSAGNSDSGSTQKIKVTYDNNEPHFIVRSPLLLTGSENSRKPDYPKDANGDYIFNNYVYDPLNRPDDTYTYISNWINKSLDFSWDIDKEMIGIYRMSFEFTNKHDLDNPDSTGKLSYFRYEWDNSDGNLPGRGIFTDKNADDVLPWIKVGDAIKSANLIETDPVTGVKSGSLSETEPTYIQVVSRLTDGAGNTQYESQGWFAWMPVSDKPWAHINFGYKTDPANPNIPLHAPDLAYMWPNTSDARNFAYDDDGVDSLTWKLYKLQETGLDPVTSGKGSADDPWDEIKHLQNESGPRGRKPWTFTAREEFGTGRFKIVVQVTDITGVTCDEYWAYFTIESANTPALRKLTEPYPIDPYEDSGERKTLFGDKSGNFNIKGVAQIQDTASAAGSDNLRVDRVSIVWIKPGSSAAESQLLYTDRNYENWDKGKDIPGGYFQDVNGNRVWELSGIQFDASTDGNKNDREQESYNFSKTLNLFNDLNFGNGTGKNPSDAQTFLIRVFSNGSGGNPRSSVSSFTTIGDVSAPELTVDEITVTKYNSVTGLYEEPKVYGSNSVLEPDALSKFDMLSTVSENDKVQFKGTWTDDSLTAWKNGVSDAVLQTLFSEFTVKWGTVPLTVPAQISVTGKTADGKYYADWQTVEYIFQQKNEEAVVTISASLTDLNGNPGIKEENIIVETDNPTLFRISSDTSDGIYGGNKDTNSGDPGSRYIDISLDFNKPVYFFNTGLPYPPNTSPYLELNNEGRAYYFDGNGSNRVKFRYFLNGASTSDLPTIPPGDQPAVNRGTDTTGNLNVTRIVWNGYHRESWRSVEGDTQVMFPEPGTSIFREDNILSLAKLKKIKIDKTAPVLSGLATSASKSKHHGVGSPIYITITFSENVTISGATQANFYLKLKGGNLLARDARAKFANAAGSASVSFRYDVEAGHDTNGANIDVDSIVLGSGLTITDEAGNAFANTAIPDTNVFNGIVIDTTAPTPPVISGITAGNYYADRTFNITGLESGNVTVEYSINADPARASGTYIWNAAGTPQGSGNNWYINGISLNINGEYHIAARQSDNATTVNTSNPSVVVGPVKIDKGNILQRVTSSTPDGIYSYGIGTQTINIDMVFRIPVYLHDYTNDTENNGAYVTLNIADSRANLYGHSADYKTWTFRYTLRTDDSVNKLDVTAINISGVTFYDRATGGTALNQDISFEAGNPHHQFAAQKNITILSGNPEVTNRNMGTGQGINFVNENTLNITFNRDIYRGDTAEKLIIKQVADDYRIPTVLEVSRWNELFIGRSDLDDAISIQGGWTPPSGYSNTKADYWRWVGNQLYGKGSNGAYQASPGNNASDLIPNTTVKYVLKFNVNPLAADTAVPISGLTMAALKNMFREAEALRFGARDGEVSITNSNRTVTVNLSGAKKLPVAGADYQWTFPNNFVKDVLGKPNTYAAASYIDSTETGALVLKKTGLEAPVIRIDKGEDEEEFLKDNNGQVLTGYNRQAVQPLTSSVKIDCRTPGTALSYRKRETTDNVGQLIWRDNPAVWNRRLPNVGIVGVAGNYTEFEATKNRPQSGLLGSTDTNGMNLWESITSKSWLPNAYEDYMASIDIGENNYNTGGMIVHIEARAEKSGSMTYAYEAAFRSVLVFNNVFNLNGNEHGDETDGNNDFVNNNNPVYLGSHFSPPESVRMWVRGGDTTTGDPSTPDFPIARDRSLYRKVRLLTPIDIRVNGHNANNWPNSFNLKNNANDGDYPYNSLPNAIGATITNEHISRNYSTYQNYIYYYTPGFQRADARVGHGQYLWFWVTWRLNVYAYIDIMAGQIPNTSETGIYAPSQVRDFFKSYIMAKEHYPVIPGRTTVLERRGGYNMLVDGGHGELVMGALTPSPAQRD